MKFVALGLTLLLVAASQAGAEQNDAPSQVEQARAEAMVYLTQVKDSALKTLEHLEGTEYAEYKVKLSENLDTLYAYAQTASQNLAPYADTFSAQFLDATRELPKRVLADVEGLRGQLEPRREELRLVLQKHAEEYRATLEPIFQEYLTKHRQEMDALRPKLQPIIDEMRAKIEANAEETKSKVAPIVDVVRARVTERLEELRSVAAPYAEEYKEQLTKAIGQLSEQVAPHTKDLQGKLEPYADAVKSRFVALYETISQAFQA